MNCKKLNNKGFSLIEILVAVSIIGIISAIAIPGFQNYRKDAAKVAGDTSVSNIAASFTNCTVLKEFSDCNTIGKLGVTCSDCTEHNTNDKMCIQLSKTIGGDDFKACFSVDSTKTPHEIKRTVGGSLLGKEVCHTKTYVGANSAFGAESSNGTDCTQTNAVTKCGASATAPYSDGDVVNTCKIASTQGVCTGNACS